MGGGVQRCEADRESIEVIITERAAQASAEAEGTRGTHSPIHTPGREGDPTTWFGFLF